MYKLFHIYTNYNSEYYINDCITACYRNRNTWIYSLIVFDTFLVDLEKKINLSRHEDVRVQK